MIARLVFFHGPMGAGKSTFALQTHFNQSRQGRRGVLVSTLDRSGAPMVTSRIGLTATAVIVGPGDDVFAAAMDDRSAGELDYVVCDEAQFLTPSQVEALVRLVDEAGVDVLAFGLLTDFQARLFPGSARLIEVADEVHRMQAIVLCWCGRPATHNARVADGVVVRSGDRVAVGDVVVGEIASGDTQVHYQALCRLHHRQGRLG